MRVISEKEIKEIQAVRGGTFTAKFIRDFDLEWEAVREAARMIKEKERNG